MKAFNEFVQRYVGLVALFGMTFSHLLNPRPGPQSLLAFALFTAFAISAVVLCIGILRAQRYVRRAGHLVRGPAYPKRMRWGTGILLAVIPAAYTLLAVTLHVPNTWPMAAGGGAEPRALSPWIKLLPNRSLFDLDEEVGPLFVPDNGMRADRRAIRYVTIHNRSTVQSPPLRVLLTLHTPKDQRWPPARVFAAAVARPAPRSWLPGSASLGGLIGSIPAEPSWLKFEPGCGDGKLDDRWCFAHPPDDRGNWLAPEVHLPAIDPRGSLELYLEVALPEGTVVGTVPAMLELHERSSGAFPVSWRRSIDLNAGLNRR